LAKLRWAALLAALLARGHDGTDELAGLQIILMSSPYPQ
jgi:hypothetical protein